MLSEERVERINENKILYDNTETCLGNCLKMEKDSESSTLHVLHYAVITVPSRRICCKVATEA